MTSPLKFDIHEYPSKFEIHKYPSKFELGFSRNLNFICPVGKISSKIFSYAWPIVAHITPTKF